jgi:hypothetical protein
MAMLAATPALAIRRHLFGWPKAGDIQRGRIRGGHAEFARACRECRHDSSHRSSTLSACGQRKLTYMLKIFFSTRADRLSLAVFRDILINGHNGSTSSSLSFVKLLCAAGSRHARLIHNFESHHTDMIRGMEWLLSQGSDE